MVGKKVKIKIAQMDLKTQDDTEVLFNQQGESGVLDAAGGGGRLSESGC